MMSSAEEERDSPPVLWPFLKACAVGFATVLAILVFLDSDARGPAQFGFFRSIVGFIVLPTLVPLIAMPAWLFARLLGLMGVQRGYMDVAVGGMLGSIMLISGDKLMLVHLAFILGAMFGGFTFWRAQGYPKGPAESDLV